jgi:hypothetical protein
MKFMLMMNTPRDGYARYLSWPRELLEAVHLSSSRHA